MKTQHIAAGGGAIALACVFIIPWEGLWTTARVDTIGTGEPVTYCYGQTNEAGAVKVGEKFTPQQCKDLLQKSLPKYWNEIAPCIHVALPDKVKAALISGAYNAGSSAMCKSPMIAHMNAGHIEEGCEAFKSWYISARGRVVKGLVNRRASESSLCMEGAFEPITKPRPSLWARIILKLKGLSLWH